MHDSHHGLKRLGVSPITAASPMRLSLVSLRRLAGVAIAAVLALGPVAASAHGSPTGGQLYAAIEPTGGAGLGPAPAPKRPAPVVHTPSKTARGAWYHRVTISEYWPAPERWFVGKLVSAPGLTGEHRIDWLYSAAGVSMQGEGLGLDGQMYHLAAAGSGGWVTATGHPTSASNGWAAGAPFWRAGAFWRNPLGAVTFPLSAGGWFASAGAHYVSLPGVSFAPGPSLPLTFYGSIAVDPKVIPLGSRVYIPSYRKDGHGGWFIAQDTGGGILGRHIDVYRTPPASSQDTGQLLTDQRVYVIKPQR
jgi:3D (Asp-Asp-Asp) domain-containing protein